MNNVSINASVSGSINYHAGRAAEHIVAQSYVSNGGQVTSERWRGSAGELDLVVQQGDALVFTEVKKSKTFANAAAALSYRQQMRIMNTAQEYLAAENLDMDTNVRFDVALVNQRGEVSILENALMQ